VEVIGHVVQKTLLNVVAKVERTNRSLCRTAMLAYANKRRELLRVDGLLGSVVYSFEVYLPLLNKLDTS
jgi:hypothetical protein